MAQTTTTSSDAFQVPSTFWRVSAKALIYDASNRLLVFMDKNHEWEIPGGGWEHNETFEQCIRRELAEEMRASVTSMSDVICCYAGKIADGRPKISIAAKVTLDGSALRPSDDDLIEARFVTKAEFLELPFQRGEATVKDCVNKIWP